MPVRGRHLTGVPASISAQARRYCCRLCPDAELKCLAGSAVSTFALATILLAAAVAFSMSPLNSPFNGTSIVINPPGVLMTDRSAPFRSVFVQLPDRRHRRWVCTCRHRQPGKRDRSRQKQLPPRRTRRSHQPDLFGDEGPKLAQPVWRAKLPDRGVAWLACTVAARSVPSRNRSRLI
jgi:hypothetical protein